ncbi:MAG: FAD-dependent oxidoreductase [Desulfobacterales bacterium]|nr:FAD-dependent oxidoreductase [Desulfobacterales bacterium]
MKTIIIGIHGMGNKPPADILEDWWRRALAEGLEKAGRSPLKVPFKLVYWADLLYPEPLDPEVTDPNHPLYLTHPYVASASGPERPSRKLRRKILTALEKILDRLMLNKDLTFNYAGVADAIIQRYFQDLDAYYAPSPFPREAIRRRLFDVLRSCRRRRILLLAHSMGSIVAYDVLHLNPGKMKVDTLVTLGSPLGLPVIIAKIAAEQKKRPGAAQSVRTPEAVRRRWCNLSDIQDKIAINFNLADDYGENQYGVHVTDFEVDNDYIYRTERNPHKVYGYLRTPEISDIIEQFVIHEPAGALDGICRWARSLGRRRRPLGDLKKFLPGRAFLRGIRGRAGSVRPILDRQTMLDSIGSSPAWDFIVIGGGATGMGCALDAAARGFRTLLLEQHDFAKGTSSRSTKLVHGGVRYLQQGNIALVLEALRERGILCRNAPHLVHDLSFIVPLYDWWEGPFYGIGLKLYDLLAGTHGFGPSLRLSRQETIQQIPMIETDGLRGGIIYHDGQFDDARLVINLAQTAVEQGATVINYMPVEALLKKSGKIAGVTAQDAETGKRYTLQARCVINATGVFADVVRQMDTPGAAKIIRPSQGVHIVLDRSFLGGDTAIMAPHTDDGRVLFAIPWYDKVLIGTTDTPVPAPTLEPLPLAEEVDFLLQHAARYLTKDPTRQDVRSMFAGLRPLVDSSGTGNTAAVSRDHTLQVSGSGLVTIAGGKWTTYRNMARETVDQAIREAGLEYRPARTKTLKVHGYQEPHGRPDPLGMYGADAPGIRGLMKQNKDLAQPLHPGFEIRSAEVVWAVRHEMARTVEDFLGRRRRMLVLDSRAGLKMAPEVAALMARELGRSRKWERQQVEQFEKLAENYLPLLKDDNQ